MKRLASVMVLLLVSALIWATVGCEKEKATPAPTPTATSVPAATATPKPTPAPTAVATATPTRAPTPTPTAPPKPEGELKIAIADMGEENPDAVFNSGPAKKYLVLMHDFLVGSTPDGELSTENGIATKWENSPDYKSWTFYLRQGIKFHNGDDLTAEDVKFSLERLGTKGARTSYAAAIAAKLQEIVVDGPYKLTVRLKNASFFLPYELSSLYITEGFVYPKRYIEANGLDYIRQHPIGSGPYRFVKQEVGQSITFEALDNHWALGVPRYKTVTFYKVPEEIARIAMLKGGQADIIDVSREQAPGLQKAGFNLFYSPTGDYVSLNLHSYTGTSNPLSDKRVREALTLAIDKQTILDTLFQGQGKLIPHSYIYPLVLGSVPLTLKPYDPERAKALLKEAGYPDSFAPELTIYSFARAGLPENAAMLEAVAAYWTKVGVKVKILPSDFTTYRSAWVAKTLVNAVGVVNAQPNKLSSTVASATRSVPPGPSTFYTNPPDLGYDAIVDQLTAAKNLDEYTEVAKKIPQYDYDNARSIYMFQVKLPYATNQKVKGWNMGYYYYDINIYGLVKR